MSIIQQIQGQLAQNIGKGRPRIRALPWVSLVGLVGGVGCSSGESAEVTERASQPAVVSCPSGTLLNPDLGSCATVSPTSNKANTVAPVPPTLNELRSPVKSAAKSQSSSSGAQALNASPQAASVSPQSTSSGSPPTPGGLGSGLIYNSGSLQALNSATLYTHMIVYPEGFGNINTWLFTTSTNRTEKGVEVVGIFYSGPESIGVFDWSCSTDYPCPGGANSPSWIWTHWLTDNTCQYSMQADPNGRQHNTVYYANTTQLSGGLWHNRVTFWNYCTNSWDLVYTHDYAGAQADCSVTGCGWWGPIMETFFPDGDPNWPVPELGFFGTSLVHDGVTSQLKQGETSFATPGPTWNVCYLNPNSAWSIGNGNSCPAITERFSTAGQFNAVDGTWATSGGKYRITKANTGASAGLNNRAVDAVYVNGDFTLNAVGSATATSDSHDNFAVTFNWVDPSNYYFASFAESNDNTVSGIFKVQNGYNTQIGDITSLIRPGQSYPVRVERDKEAIRVYLNNTLAGQTNDLTFVSGWLGVGARNNTATFDDFVVTTPRIVERFDVAAPRWVVNSGSWAVSGGAYQLLSPTTVSAAGLNNSSYHEWPMYGDFTVTANVMATATSAGNDNVAFVFDAIDSGTYYYASFGEVSDTSTNGVFKVSGGVVTKLGTLNETFPPGMIHNIAVSRSGNVITVSGKGRLQATVTDTSYTTPYGFMGFGTNNDSASVDNLVVY